MSFDLESLFLLASKTPGMDLWVPEGRTPFFKGRGKVIPVPDSESIPADFLRTNLAHKMDSKSLQAWESQGHCRFRLSRGAGIVFRVDLSREGSGVLGIFRAVPTILPTLDSLRVPPAVKGLINLRSGLVMFAGPGSSGTTTLSSSFAAAVCQQRAVRVRILDTDPEWTIPQGQSFMVRGAPLRAISEDIQASLVSGTEMFVFGDIEPPEMHNVLEACAGGALVLANIRASSATHAVERILEGNSLLFRSLRAVVACHLVPSLSGEEMLPIWDVLLANRSLMQALEQGEVQKLPQLQKASQGEGMVYLDDSLSLLVNQGRIHKSEAKYRAHEPQLFE